MSRRQLLRLIEAHDAVWLGWWPTLTALGRSRIRRRLLGSFPTLSATTAHMVDAERYWQDRIECRPERGHRSPYKTMSQLEDGWLKVRTRRLAWLERADLRVRVRFTAMGGDIAHVSVGECVIHIATHAHFHRGQLAMQCRQLGVTPPSRHLLGSFFDEWRLRGRRAHSASILTER